MKDKVLVVDDDADEVELLTTALDRLGFAAEGTTSPARALERAAAEAFDVILTDIGMAEMDGLAL
jgi:CheY-like chemotaxis protein